MNLIEMTGLKRPSVDLDMDVASMIIVACVIPAFTEELAFRGTIVQSLAREKKQTCVFGDYRSVVRRIPYESRLKRCINSYLALLWRCSRTAAEAYGLRS